MTSLGAGRTGNRGAGPGAADKVLQGPHLAIGAARTRRPGASSCARAPNPDRRLKRKCSPASRSRSSGGDPLAGLPVEAVIRDGETASSGSSASRCCSPAAKVKVGLERDGRVQVLEGVKAGGRWSDARGLCRQRNRARERADRPARCCVALSRSALRAPLVLVRSRLPRDRLCGVHHAQHRGLSGSGAADHRADRAMARQVGPKRSSATHDPDRRSRYRARRG